MENIPSFNQAIQQSVIDHWDLDALTDYKGATLQFHDVARKIEKLHILFENCGVVKGDKIALCGRNSSQWAVAFLATLTYGAVAVPILHEFMADQIHNIVNHSDAKLLFVGDHVATQIDPEQMPNLEGIINNPDYSLMVSRTDKLTFAREHLNELYGKKFPKFFRKEHVHYYIEENGEELAMINYTSGTTGFSKGVMVPYRALWSNYDFAEHVLGETIDKGDRIISILPMAHMYGMAFEFIFEFLHGCHVYYLNRIPSPAIIAQAFAEIKPKIAEQPHETAVQHACHFEESAPDDMQGSGEGLRRTSVRGDYRWCCLQPGSGVFPEEDRIPLYGGLRRYGVRPNHLLSRLEDFCSGFVWTGCLSHGGENQFGRPCPRAWRDTGSRTERDAGLLQERGSYTRNAGRRGLVPYGRLGHYGLRRQRIYQRTFEEHAAWT